MDNFYKIVNEDNNRGQTKYDFNVGFRDFMSKEISIKVFTTTEDSKTNDDSGRRDLKLKEQFNFVDDI